LSGGRSAGEEGVHFRDADPNDRAAVVEVTLAAYAEYAAALPGGLWSAYRDSIVAALERGEAPQRLVAEDGGKVVGSVLLYPAGTASGGPDAGAWPEIRLLAVAPVARGRGIGSALVRECVRCAGAAGATAVSLHTTDMMQVAMAMYERMGFVRSPETDLQPAPGVTAKGYRLDI
jgi:predicted N-acetyltransferase YhbS